VALDYSTPNLLNMVRDISFAGSSQRDWPDSRLIRLINREIGEYMVPFIMRARKNHFVDSKDVALVTGQTRYRLPSKATGMKLRAVQLVDAAGAAVRALQEAELEQAMGLDDTQGMPEVYYFVGNQIALRPVPSASLNVSLRLWYVSRPNTLVAPTDTSSGVINALQVTGTPGGAPGGSFRLSYTASSQPSWLTASASLDIVQNKPGFDVLGTFPVTAATSSTADLTGTLPADIAVGDWFCPTDTAPVITGSIPEIVVGCLIKKVTLEATAAKGDQEGFGRLAGLLKLDEDKATQFLNRRSTGDHRAAGSMSVQRFKRGAIRYPW
jgi:hypothetical protein